MIGYITIVLSNILFMNYCVIKERNVEKEACTFVKSSDGMVYSSHGNEIYSTINGNWINCFSISDCSCGQEISNNNFDNTVWELNENIVDGINELIKKNLLYNGQVYKCIIDSVDYYVLGITNENYTINKVGVIEVDKKKTTLTLVCNNNKTSINYKKYSTVSINKFNKLY